MYDGSSLKIVADRPTTEQEQCTIVSVTANSHSDLYAPPAPSCSTKTTVITEYLSITPTNCLQSTHTKEMSKTVGTGDTDTVTARNSNTSLNTATGGVTSNSSPVILGAFIVVLSALLVAVTTGWIVTCVRGGSRGDFEGLKPPPFEKLPMYC